MPRGLAVAVLFGMAVVPGADAARDPVPVLASLEVRIDPQTRDLDGTGVWTVPPGESLAIVLADRFDAPRVTVDGQPLAAEPDRNGRRRWRLSPSERVARRVEIEWHGRLDPLDASLDHRQVLRPAAPVTAPHGTFLPGAAQWHPLFIGRPLQYTVAVDLPQSQRAIVAGDPVSDRIANGRRLQAFRFAQPGPAIDLIVTALKSSDPEVRKAAAEALGKH